MHVSLLACLLLGLLQEAGASSARPLPADEAPLASAQLDSVEAFSKKRFTAEAGYRFQVFPDSDVAMWQAYTTALRYETRLGTFGAEYRRLSRFEHWDDAAVLDAYPALWGDAYAHFRYQHIFDAEVYADDEVLVELFQPLGGGWVPFLTYHHRSYAAGPVQSVSVFGGGTDKYVGRWFLRGRAELLLVEGESSGFGSLLVRRFLNAGAGPTSGTYLEAKASYGAEAIITSLVPTQFDSGTTYSASLGGQLFFTPTWGTAVIATLVNSAALPTRAGLSLRLKARW